MTTKYKRDYPRTPEQIAAEISGTCAALYKILENHDMEDAHNDIEFLRDFDDHVFECGCCGWWCETSECAHSDGHSSICFECAEE